MRINKSTKIFVSETGLTLGYCVTELKGMCWKLKYTLYIDKYFWLHCMVVLEISLTNWVYRTKFVCLFIAVSVIQGHVSRGIHLYLFRTKFVCLFIAVSVVGMTTILTIQVFFPSQFSREKCASKVHEVTRSDCWLETKLICNLRLLLFWLSIWCLVLGIVIPENWRKKKDHAQSDVEPLITYQRYGKSLKSLYFLIVST